MGVYLFYGKVPEAGLLNKCSCLARALGLTKFTTMRDMILVTLCCATKVRLECLTKPPLASYYTNRKKKFLGKVV